MKLRHFLISLSAILVVILFVLAHSPDIHAGELGLGLRYPDGSKAYGDRLRGEVILYVIENFRFKYVDFFLDGEMVKRDMEQPFEFRFDTRDYPPGKHKLGARGYNNSLPLQASFTVTFVQPSQSEGPGKEQVFEWLVAGGLLALLLFLIWRWWGPKMV